MRCLLLEPSVAWFAKPPGVVHRSVAPGGGVTLNPSINPVIDKGRMYDLASCQTSHHSASDVAEWLDKPDRA